MEYDWNENSRIKTKIEKSETDGDSFWIIANKEGLLTLAGILTAMAEDDVPDKRHIHLDYLKGWYASLEKGSMELSLMKDNSIEHIEEKHIEPTQKDFDDARESLYAQFKKLKEAKETQ